MFSKLSLVTKKKISLLIVCVIFMSCFSITIFESNNTFKFLSIYEKLSKDNTVDIFYEILLLQYNIAENKYKEGNFKIYSNDKIEVHFVFINTNNADKLMNKSIQLHTSLFDSIQDTILLFIHNKDGKKQLL